MKTTNEWVNYFIEKNNGQNNLWITACGLEQAYKHSLKEKYCANCGARENLVEQEASCWIMERYYLCNDCIKYKKG